MESFNPIKSAPEASTGTYVSNACDETLRLDWGANYFKLE